LRATVLAAVLTGIYVVNYQQGWIEAEDLDFMPEPPAHLQR
jgi:hypothetical protein